MDTNASEVVLTAPSEPATTAPAFLAATIRLTGGLAVSRIRACLANGSEVDVLATESAEGPATTPLSLAFAGEILAPYANRLTGELSADRESVAVRVRDRRQRDASDVRVVDLPALKKPERGGAHPFAIHGLLNQVLEWSIRARASNRLEAELRAGDFDGRWISAFDLVFAAEIARTGFGFTLTATNVGPERAPIGLGWHPYFALPSGQRTRARMRLPSRKRLRVNNYDEVLPTGEIVSVEGTEYDFSAPHGALLDAELYLDDCYVDLEKTSDGLTVAEVIDEAASYGVRIVASSPEVSAIQTYSPPGKPFIVLEPQFNWADPFGVQWPPDADTGMVWLEPEQTVSYAVRLELFIP